MNVKLSIHEWLDKYFLLFLMELGWDQDNAESYCELIAAHGDKAHQYERIWETLQIPYEHGTAIYLLSHIPPHSKEVRHTADGQWVSPPLWVIDNYEKFKPALDAAMSRAEIPN